MAAEKARLVAPDAEEVEFSEIPGHFDDVSDLEDDIDDQLRSITSEFGGEAGEVEFKLHVKRILKGKGEKAHLFVCLSTELPILDRLRDDYGGGRFEVWVNRNGRRFKRYVVIVEAPKEKILSMANNDNATMIMEGFGKLGELIAGQQNQAPPAFDPVSMMSQMMSQMMVMKEFLGGSSPAALPVPAAVDPLAIVERVMAIQNTLGGAGSGEGATMADVMVELTRTFGPPIADLSMRAQAEHEKGAVGASAGVSPGMGGVRGGASAETGADDASLSVEDKKMRSQLMFLVSFAKKNLDPAPYAQMVVDHSGDVRALVDFVSDAAAIDKMILLCPAVEGYRDWFVELGECILELTGAELTESDESTNTVDNVSESGNPSDPGGGQTHEG